MGGVIKNDVNVAQTVATSLMSALDELNQGTTITLDEQTTIEGNSKAHETSEKMQSGIEKISLAVGNASGNITSVSDEFEALDKSIRDIMNGIRIG